MKTTLLSFVALWAMNSNAQLAITEICESDPMNGVMVDTELYNDTIYATGFFTQVCGSNVDHVAKWDGSQWVPAGFGFPNDGHSLRTIGNDLYGVTYVDNPTDSNWLYRYDGTNLTTVGAGVYLTTATNFSNLACIYDVAEYNGDIYICGEFDRVGNQQISGIARWDGTSWSAVSGGFSGNIPNNASLLFPHQMKVINGQLYCAGNFRFAGGVEVNGLAVWDGTTWSSIGNGFNGTVYSMGTLNNELYVGGAFTESNGTILNRIAKWDGTDWVSPGFGFTDVSPFFIFVHTIYEENNGLYIAGGLKEMEVDNASNETVGGIVYYDGTNLEAFSGGVSGNDIEAIVEDDNGQLLVGGGVFGNGYVGIVQDVTSIDEYTFDVIEISPNPVLDVFTVTSDVPLDLVQVLDLSGSIVYESSENFEIDASRWDSGAYWVRSSSDGALYTKKFVKL